MLDRESILKIIVGEYTKINPNSNGLDINVGGNTQLNRIGLSSLELLMLLVQLEEKTGVNIDNTFETVEELINHILEWEKNERISQLQYGNI